jgi:N-acetylneuraminic acid mutarotase
MTAIPRIVCPILMFLASAGCGDDPPAAPAPPSGAAGAGGTGGSGGGGGPSGSGGTGAPAGGAAGTAGQPASLPRDGGAASPDGGGPDRPGAPDASPATPPAAGDPAAGEYGTRALLPERNSEFAIAELDGKIYVLGGYPTNPSQTRPTLQIYDPKTNQWTLGTPSPLPLHHPMIAGVQGKLYSLGGQPNTNLVLVYDPATDTWSGDRMPMPTARGGGAAAVIGTKIYVVGARPPGLTPEAENAFEVYDVAANSWETLPKLPTERFNQRNHLAAVAIGGKIYVAGGRYNGGGFASPMTDALEMYDPATRTWTARANMLRPRGGVYGVVAFGCLHLIGGEGSGIGEPNDVFPDHDVYNPLTDTWTAARRLPIPFHGVTGGAFVDGVIYMPGGGISSGGSSGTTMHQVFRPAMRCE